MRAGDLLVTRRSRACDEPLLLLTVCLFAASDAAADGDAITLNSGALQTFEILPVSLTQQDTVVLILTHKAASKIKR